ncbi:excisionase [Stenotrophomonas maltophilia]|uniref:Excisionase n=1 Tax=Stenotrophomonas maltophilia TaxID=40324 RepID=A0AB34TC08_STEMA|nr:excisionase [Stenotrophomonas maltophilia]KOQ79661.1 excisionase [Stenotrophomonas maltophilia]MBN4981985.1 excisionase [Stenotrophomonas maltophilia]
MSSHAPSARGLLRAASPANLRPVRYVTLKQFEALTGYTVDATNSKIKRGDWLEGAVFIKAPDGRNLIDLEGYEEWVVQGKAASGQFHKAASR